MIQVLLITPVQWIIFFMGIEIEFPFKANGFGYKITVPDRSSVPVVVEACFGVIVLAGNLRLFCTVPSWIWASPKGR